LDFEKRIENVFSKVWCVALPLALKSDHVSLFQTDFADYERDITEVCRAKEKGGFLRDVD